MWWVDVETANSWSTSNVTLNRYTIQGATDRFVQLGFEAGIYSTASSWSRITGTGYTPPRAVAEWVAGGSCSTPFDASPVWLSQYTSGGVDYDTAC